MADDEPQGDLSPDVPGDGLTSSAGAAELAELRDRVEAALMGGERRFTRSEVAQQSGVSVEESRTYWRALGFAAVDDDQRAFGDDDVEVLGRVRQLRAIGDFDEAQMLAISRIIGQSFARLASWQGQFILEMLANRSDLLDASAGDSASPADRAVELIEELAPVVSELQDWVWRRQLASFFARAAANAGVGAGSTSEMAVGFVDMAGFTTFTRRSTETELRGVLTAFETLATDVVVGHGGQIVKTIGDEILFTAASGRDAALIALDMVEQAGDDDVLPQLRGGVAFGSVVSRMGDVYGQPVNIASRLTSIARTDSVLADDVLAKRLADDDAVVLHPMRPVAVRGYRHLKPWRLRLPEPAR